MHTQHITHLALQLYPHAMAHENNLFNMHLFISYTPYLKFAYFALQKWSESEVVWYVRLYLCVCARFCLVFACIKYFREHECKSANVQLQYIHFINQNDNNALDTQRTVCVQCTFTLIRIAYTRLSLCGRLKPIQTVKSIQCA